jgi:Flp pilus assembly protein TadG
MSRFRWSRLFRPYNRFAGDKSGVSAIEFALILPLMLTLYIGGNEFGHAYTLKRKVTNVTSTIADLVTQSKTITNADMANIFDAAAALMTPYSANTLRMKVSLIYIDKDKVATVLWSDAINDTSLVVNDTITIPDDVNTAKTYVVTSEVHYQYTPTIGYVLTGPIDLWDQFYLRPRQGASISRTS